jgi:predicted nucleic acid-binding protein
VLAEACYLIDRGLGAAAEATFLEDVGVGAGYAYQLTALVDADVRRMSALVRRYADRRLGGTDASIIAVCERLDLETVATLNRRDFDNVAPQHRRVLTIVPE